MDSTEQLNEMERLYRQAFADYGTKALWGSRPARHPSVLELEWAVDATFRFFPAQPDQLFGYVLHPVDLATNKASAAADRRVPRDIVDLVTVHDSILPLGAVVSAAVGRFPGVTPEEMLAEIVRHSRFTAEEFAALATVAPIDVPSLHLAASGHPHRLFRAR